MPFGRNLLTTNTVFPTRVSADGSPFYKAGGITLDLTTIAAASGSDVTLPDGSTIKANNQFLRYGQVVCKITTAPVQTLTGTATGGTFTLTALRPDTQQLVTTAALAATATAAQILAALQAVMGPNQVTSATGGALGTATVPVTFNGFVPLMTVNGALLTGGTVTIAATTAGTAAGKYGPYDPAASDGRQTLTRGECFILDETFVVNPSFIIGVGNNEIIGGAIEGGLLFRDRILHSGTATHTLALGPTFAEIGTAFPTARFVEN